MFNGVIGPVLQLWLAGQCRPERGRSAPTGRPQVDATGPDADRILLIVDRPSVGDGVLSHELGLAGHLARQLSTLSGRGTDIDVLANGNTTVAGCATALGTVDLARFDAIILMLGSSEALSLSSTRRWAAELAGLLDDIDGASPHRSHTFVVEVPPVRALLGFPQLLAAIVSAQIMRLNSAAARVFGPRQRLTVALRPCRRYRFELERDVRAVGSLPRPWGARAAGPCKPDPAARRSCQRGRSTAVA